MKPNLITISLFLIHIFFPVYFHCQLIIQPVNNNIKYYNNKHSSFSDVSANNNNNQLLSQVVNIFHISRADLRWFESYFQLKSLELLYPKTLAMIHHLKRCVLGVKFRANPNRGAAIKLEFDQQVRARFDGRSRTVVCSNPSRPVYGTPTEKSAQKP